MFDFLKNSLLKHAEKKNFGFTTTLPWVNELNGLAHPPFANGANSEIPNILTIDIHELFGLNSQLGREVSATIW